MAHQSLDRMIESFDPNAASVSDPCPTNGGRSITFWVSAEHKAAYDELQKISRRSFAKHLRNVLTASIDKAKAKTG